MMARKERIDCCNGLVSSCIYHPGCNPNRIKLACMCICYMSSMCKMRTWKLGFRREIIGQSEMADGG